MKRFNCKWSNEEINYLKKNYETLGPKQCAIDLQRPKRGVFAKAKELSLKMNQKSKNRLITKYTKEIIEKAVKNSKCYADVMRNVGIIPQAGNFKNIKKHIEFYKVDVSHFLSPGELSVIRISQGKNLPPNHYAKKNVSEYFKIGNSVKGERLKKGLFEEGYKEKKCEKCGQNEDWYGEKIVLILDHVNGNHFDNRLENLRILCPNCDSTLDTYCSRNRKKVNNEEINEEINETIKPKSSPERKSSKYMRRCSQCNKDYSSSNKTQKYCSNVCSKLKQRKVERPTYEQLLVEVENNGYSATGRKYNVSDKSIVKWIKQYQKE